MLMTLDTSHPETSLLKLEASRNMEYMVVAELVFQSEISSLKLVTVEQYE